MEPEDRNGEAPRFVLLNDVPCRDAEDPLDFGRLAEGLAALIRESAASTPMTLGIQAPWGMGKSTLMRQLDAALRRSGGSVKTVWFNAWTFEGRNVLEGLVKTALNQLDGRLLRQMTSRKKMMSAVRLVTTTISGFFQAGAAADKFWDVVSANPSMRNAVQARLREAMRTWRADDPGRLLVVFIDDLDRCSPENVFRVFEALKLYLNAPGFVFVVGFDRQIIAEAILEHKKYSEQLTSGHYLEKIIQISYNIPRPTPEHLARLFDVYAHHSRTRSLLADDTERLIIERSDANPRRIKRFLNRFILEHQLDEQAAALPPPLLIKILLLQMHFGRFCDLYRDQEGRDPITEFLAFVAAAEVLRSEQHLEDAAPTFEAYGLAPPAPDDDLKVRLTALEEAVPEEFLELIKIDDFVSLVQGIAPEERRLVTEHLLNKNGHVAFAPPPRRRYDVSGLTGLHILWLTDRPDDAAELRTALLRGGVSLESVFRLEDARVALGRRRPGVLVSNVARGGDPEAGFRDLVTLREEDGYDGAAIFFTLRLTKNRRLRARALGASITSSPEELLRLLHGAAATATS